MEQMEITSLPDYGARPIDTWRASQDHNNTHVGFDSLDYPNGDPKVGHQPSIDKDRLSDICLWYIIFRKIIVATMRMHSWSVVYVGNILHPL